MSYLHSYRGTRRKKKKRLLTALLILILLIAAALVAFLLLQEHIVYTSDGGFYFDFAQDRPSGDVSAPPVSVTPSEDVPLIIEGSAESNTGETPVTPDAPPASSAAPQLADAYYAKLCTPEELISGSYPAEEFTAVAVTVKGIDGVCWLPDPLETEAGSGDANALRDVLAKYPGLKIAVISAYRDPIRPRSDRTLALQVASGATWLDWDYCSWIDPLNSRATDNLRALMQSCADLGFDQVVLTDFQFPTRGKTALINYGTVPPDFTAELSRIAGELTADAPLPCSVLLNAQAAADGNDATAGQDAAALAALFDSVLLPTADLNAGAAAAQALALTNSDFWLTEAPDTVPSGRVILAK